MATLAATQVDFNFGVLPLAGFPIEIWRVASGGANGDTVTITPARFDLVKAVLGGPTSNDLTTTPATNVTLTLKGGTVTAGAFDVMVIGFQRQ